MYYLIEYREAGTAWQYLYSAESKYAADRLLSIRLRMGNSGLREYRIRRYRG